MPLSTGLLVQPVKARPCGHVYSTASAKAFFKGQGKKCAVFGCDKMLKWSDFVKDKASEIALREARKRRERTQRPRPRRRRGRDRRRGRRVSKCTYVPLQRGQRVQQAPMTPSPRP